MKHLHRAALRFPRTSGDAFKDATYATAFERHPKGKGIGKWLAYTAFAVMALVLIARGA